MQIFQLSMCFALWLISPSNLEKKAQTEFLLDQISQKMHPSHYREAGPKD